MRADPDREKFFDETLSRIVESPSAEGLELLLHSFLGVLNEMELHAERQMHQELLNHFGGRYCRSQICRLMAELVTGHLETRQAQPSD